MMRRAAPILVLLCAGCTVDVGPPSEAPVLDVDVYAEQVDPVVRFSCASLDCHGVEGRVLRIYAQDGLRQSVDLRGEPLSPGEADWNAQAFSGVDPMPPSIEQHVALLKPLAVGEGGMAHRGGDVWPNTQDPGYLCVLAWLGGGEDQAACAEAAAAVDPYPPSAP